MLTVICSPEKWAPCQDMLTELFMSMIDADEIEYSEEYSGIVASALDITMNEHTTIAVLDVEEVMEFVHDFEQQEQVPSITGKELREMVDHNAGMLETMHFIDVERLIEFNLQCIGVERIIQSTINTSRVFKKRVCIGTDVTSTGISSILDRLVPEDVGYGTGEKVYVNEYSLVTVKVHETRENVLNEETVPERKFEL